MKMFGKQTKFPTRFLAIGYLEVIQMNFHDLCLSHLEKMFDFFKAGFHVLQHTFLLFIPIYTFYSARQL